jgi:hypothetical protein
MTRTPHRRHRRTWAPLFAAIALLAGMALVTGCFYPYHHRGGYYAYDHHDRDWGHRDRDRDRDHDRDHHRRRGDRWGH